MKTPPQRIQWIGGIQRAWLRRIVLVLTLLPMFAYTIVLTLAWLALRLGGCFVLAVLEGAAGIVTLLSSMFERWERPLVLVNRYTGRRRPRADVNADPYGLKDGLSEAELEHFRRLVNEDMHRG